ncbi:MAG: TetR/AcrR family transcriptional regulator [Rhodobacteraceae bacterium]|uniref:TetR/AcrR family transcriptional regulator n=1 Tax=Albidovulum sp. TaxID=1872424 RepID=UPI001DD70667|nr:TetR/AcrR family transcriptional regulator [uncultured Defluviimonas sp.]MCB2126326.1 TetR/AcrR family transcriptional regulator [Paracoccaceae bacterium]
MSSDSALAGAQMADSAPPARERILSTAGPLFYREGFRAVGVDRVIAEAGVAKATFYKHFPSKDDLIVAWVKRAEALTAAAAPQDDGPRPLLAYAEAMIALAAADGCLGCTFQVTAAEFSDPGHPAHVAAAEAKRRVLDELERRARAQGLALPRQTAEAVFLLIEGVWAGVRMFGGEAPLDAARLVLRKIAG